METLLILADLGRVRAFVLRPAGLDPREQPHFDELPNSPVELLNEAIGDVTTDQAGRFPQGGGSAQLAGMSYGENHQLATELQSRALGRVAASIGQIVAAQGYPGWRLAAPSQILPALQAALTPPTRAALARTEPANLTKLTLAELEGRFLGG